MGAITLVTSATLLVELADVLHREKFAQRLARANVTAHALVFGYAALARLVIPAPIEPVVTADPDDDAVLACAVAARVEVIVSGDRDLLTLESYEGIAIITAVQLLARIAAELANSAEPGSGADAQ
jgi:putative PIN family toxin of toxin-antitoxin system